jgi:hypothetical protein
MLVLQTTRTKAEPTITATLDAEMYSESAGVVSLVAGIGAVVV